MATETATIRVARTTRDRLATQARERGISLSSLLSEMARQREMEAIWESERLATLTDAQSSVAQDDTRLWEATLEDGID